MMPFSVTHYALRITQYAFADELTRHRRRPPVRTGTLPALSPSMILAPRYLPRLTATVGLFTRYGLADFAKQQGLSILTAETEPTDEDGSTVDRATALRHRLVELGPAYVKLGQVLSTRPDLFPPAYIRE